jgi:catalase
MLTPEQVVDGINRRFGRHAGARALHAKGTVFSGTFTATPEAGRLTRAAHMQGQPVDVTVRYSNGSGEPDSRDFEPDVRGMATTFQLPGGDRTDISAQTVPHFSVPTVDAFVELVQATEPSPRALYRFPLLLAKNPKALVTLRKNASGLKPPTSFATRPYYAIHAFKWVDADGGERYVRYRWVPESEEKPLGIREARKRGPEYLFDDLRERLGGGVIRFTLELQIAAEGDAVDDPTSNWPSDRERVNAGALEVTGVADETDSSSGFVFDPMRLTDGIEPSDDPILNFRPRAYSVSAGRRMDQN